MLNASNINPMPQTEVFCMPNFLTKVAATGFIAKAPIGRLSKSSPSWASSRSNLVFTKGIKVAQLPKRRPTEINIRPIEKLCLLPKKSLEI